MKPRWGRGFAAADVPACCIMRTVYPTCRLGVSPPACIPAGAPRETCACGPPAKDRSNHGSNHQSSQGGHRRLRVRGLGQRLRLMQSGLFSEMVLIDVDHDRAEGEALDIAHGMAFGSPMNIYAATTPISTMRLSPSSRPGRTRRPARRASTWSTRTSPSSSPSSRRSPSVITRHPAGGLEPRGHPDLRGLKLSGMPANRVPRQRHHARHRALKYALAQAPASIRRNVTRP